MVCAQRVQGSRDREERRRLGREAPRAPFIVNTRRSTRATATCAPSGRSSRPNVERWQAQGHQALHAPSGTHRVARLDKAVGPRVRDRFAYAQRRAGARDQRRRGHVHKGHRRSGRCDKDAFDVVGRRPSRPVRLPGPELRLRRARRPATASSYFSPYMATDRSRTVYAEPVEDVVRRAACTPGRSSSPRIHGGACCSGSARIKMTLRQPTGQHLRNRSGRSRVSSTAGLQPNDDYSDYPRVNVDIQAPKILGTQARAQARTTSPRSPAAVS